MVVEIVTCQGLNTGRKVGNLLNPFNAVGAIGGAAVDGVMAVGGTALKGMNKVAKKVGVGGVPLIGTGIKDGIYVKAETGNTEVHRTDKIDNRQVVNTLNVLCRKVYILLTFCLGKKKTATIQFIP